MIKRCLLLLLLLPMFRVFSQEQHCLWLNPKQIETIFFERNLDLLAERLNVSIADASIVQAKLWNNPTFSLTGVNLWSSESQREGETIPPLFGSFGRNTQFVAELSQMISVAGQRSKLAKMEMVSKEIALVQFEQVLKGLKLELYRLIANVVYQQDYMKVLMKQREELYGLTVMYQKQYDNGNISKWETVRLKSALLEFDSEINDLKMEINASGAKLRNLLAIKSGVSIGVMADSADNCISPKVMNIENMIETALEKRTDVNMERLKREYNEKSIKYEKSLRAPDLNFNVAYDRRGGVWRDFIGFGVGLDIPVFNRNQGAIKSAKIRKEQSELTVSQSEIAICNEVVEAYGNYVQIYDLYDGIKNSPIVEELDEMLGIYAKNLLDRNISMAEYMDFMDSYKSTKQLLLTNKRDLHLQFEELKYVVGTEIF